MDYHILSYSYDGRTRSFFSSEASFFCYKTSGLFETKLARGLQFSSRANSLEVSKGSVFLLLFKVSLQELLLNITRNRLVVREVHCECRAT